MGLSTLFCASLEYSISILKKLSASSQSVCMRAPHVLGHVQNVYQNESERPKSDIVRSIFNIDNAVAVDKDTQLTQ